MGAAERQGIDVVLLASDRPERATLSQARQVAMRCSWVAATSVRRHPVGRPEYLRQQAEMSLRRLGVERIDLFQLHRIDPTVPLADQLGVFAELQKEGKIGHIGLSEVTVDEIKQAGEYAQIATVQNLYNLSNRTSEAVLDYCQAEGIGFIPWFPIATGELAKPGGPLDALSTQTGATPAQLALAWLLHRSRVMLPIPGTSKVAHLEENVAATGITLTAEQLASLDGVPEQGGPQWQ